MKAAILDENGRLLLFRKLDRVRETWKNGKCRMRIDAVADESGVVLTSTPEPTAKALAQYFEVKPEHVPGRAVTESELRRIAEDSAGPGASTVMPYIRSTVDALGITVVPDPEPTNLQLLSRAIRDWEEGRGADRVLARHLNALGVKVPGGQR